MLLRGIKGFFKVRNGGKGNNRKASSSNSTFLAFVTLLQLIVNEVKNFVFVY